MSNVTLAHRNVCKDGFTIVDTADAGTIIHFPSCLLGRKAGGDRTMKVNDGSLRSSVFLDLPAPWEAVQHAKSALRVRQSGLYLFCRYSLTDVSIIRSPPRKIGAQEFAALAHAWSKY